ncbi:MAG: flavodoxin domain-containing protein [Chitinivibrionales bacterium]|nr:flavodoxin domain-containing protein [Chitinivibrionales bacterium]
MKKAILTLLVLMLADVSNAQGVNMKNVLIVYGSFAGSTAAIADSMRSCLQTKNCAVDVMAAAGAAINLDKYDLVVIGSAIRGDNIHPKVKQFIDANRPALNKKKAAVFAVCITITSVKPQKREHARTYPGKVACGLHPVSNVVFAGNAPSAGRFGNWMGKMIFGIVPGDYRDWKAIKTWAESLTALY